ncbi:MAG: YbaB/EbfC family nucleoid-associated protein [Dermatophilaceae bacterium]
MNRSDTERVEHGARAPAARGGVPPARARIDDDRDLDDILDALDADREALGAAGSMMSAVEAVGRSADRLVEVRVRGLGSLSGVVIHPDAMRRHDHVSLAAAVVDAFKVASQAAATEVVGAFPQVFGDIGDWVDPPEVEHGEASAASVTPEAHRRAVTAWREASHGAGSR